MEPREQMRFYSGSAPDLMPDLHLTEGTKRWEDFSTPDLHLNCTSSDLNLIYT
jgi:hypothetical protein